MAGGILQLVAFGSQDLYLSGNPQVTFFKLVYRRHTNFSQETIEQSFNGQPGFGKRVTCQLARNGDLVHKVWLMVTLKDVSVAVPSSVTDPNAVAEFRWLNWIGHTIIKTVEIEIGGQPIDKHYGEFMHVYAELSMEAGHQNGYANMVGNVPRLVNPTIASATTGGKTHPGLDLYIPLQFYFCRNPGLALPLVALQYHEVKINVEFRPLDECCHAIMKTTAPGPNGTTVAVSTPHLGMISDQTFDAKLLVDYIFLDSEERRRFAQSSHEYLITQVQFTGNETTQQRSGNKFKLAFNHPTKELIWYGQMETNTKMESDGGPRFGRQWFNFTTKSDKSYISGSPLDPMGGGIGYSASLGITGESSLERLRATASNLGNYNFDSVYDGDGDNITDDALLQLNGHDRFTTRKGRWFNLCIPYAAHKSIPSTGINVYNFALRPDEHQPSGSLNFSRIDNATLLLTVNGTAPDPGASGNKTVLIKIYAISYNVLRVLSGMGGLSYSS